MITKEQRDEMRFTAAPVDEAGSIEWWGKGRMLAVLDSLDEMECDRDGLCANIDRLIEGLRELGSYCAEEQEMRKAAEKERDEWKMKAEAHAAACVAITEQRDGWKARAERAEATIAEQERVVDEWAATHRDHPSEP